MNTYHSYGRTLIIVSVFLLSSCKNYFKVKDGSASLKPDSVIHAYNHRYFILRSGNTALYMSDPQLSPDRKFLSSKLDTLPVYHQLYLHHGIGGHMQYKKMKPDTVVLSEVHFYIPTDT
ncbi:MAG TPA: hypothetical protein VHT72_10355, partial [Puia sp.]|nr:hypothetical protein [Puia sp.]